MEGMDNGTRLDRGVTVTSKGHQAALGKPAGVLSSSHQTQCTNQMHALYQSRRGTCPEEAITMVIRIRAGPEGRRSKTRTETRSGREKDRGSSTVLLKRAAECVHVWSGLPCLMPSAFRRRRLKEDTKRHFPSRQLCLCSTVTGCIFLVSGGQLRTCLVPHPPDRAHKTGDEQLLMQQHGHSHSPCMEPLKEAAGTLCFLLPRIDTFLGFGQVPHGPGLSRTN